MNIELKPCPFCGGKAEARISPNSRSEEGASFYEVRCKKCGVHVTGKSFNFWTVKYDREKPQDLLSAVERWNKRAYEEDGRWIPVKERLPENSGTYLVYVRDEHIDRTNEYMSVVYFSKFTGEFSTASKWHKVLAWIPCPEPYKEVDE